MNHNSNGARQEHHDVAAETAPPVVNVGVLIRQIDHEQIARRAYAIFESRHRIEGHADEDWFQAEAEYATRHVGGPARRRRWAADRE
jgi:hypothetical protein